MYMYVRIHINTFIDLGCMQNTCAYFPAKWVFIIAGCLFMKMVI